MDMNGIDYDGLRESLYREYGIDKVAAVPFRLKHMAKNVTKEAVAASAGQKGAASLYDMYKGLAGLVKKPLRTQVATVAQTMKPVPLAIAAGVAGGVGVGSYGMKKLYDENRSATVSGRLFDPSSDLGQAVMLTGLAGAGLAGAGLAAELLKQRTKLYSNEQV